MSKNERLTPLDAEKIFLSADVDVLFGRLVPRRPGRPHLRDLAGVFVWMDFGPALKGSRGRYNTAIALRAAAYVAHTIWLWVAPPPLGDAYPPPSEARRAYTALPVRPLLSYGPRPRFSWLARPDG